MHEFDERRPAVTRSTARILAFFALALLTWTGPGGGDDAIAAEAPKIVTYCFSCHGEGGRSTSPLYPRLAGQQKEYIIAQLKDFREGTRTAPHGRTYLDFLVMWGFVAQLDPSTTDAVATFFASQAPVPGEPVASPEVMAGKTIYTAGIPSESVPACTSCHGASAQGNGPIPRLAGQHQAYLARQLEAFASWARLNVAMHANSVNLTPQQISEVTAYLATQ